MFKAVDLRGPVLDSKHILFGRAKRNVTQEGYVTPVMYRVTWKSTLNVEA